MSRGRGLELRELVEIYGELFLAQLLGVSATKVRRFAAGGGAVPPPIAARIALVARVTDHLSGSYDSSGIRRWWARPRAALGSRSPRDALGTDWDPHGPDARAVAELAQTLAGDGGGDVTNGADPANPPRGSSYARMRFRTATGSVYELVRDERGMGWSRLSATMASGPLRGSGAWPLRAWPEVTIGTPVELVVVPGVSET
jgi:hypothetical protein